MAEETSIVLPKCVHIIWAGGSLYLPDEHIRGVVLSWASSNPDVPLYLWVDFKTARGSSIENKKDQLITYYQTIFQEFGLRVYYHELPSSLQPSITAPIIVKDITEEGIVDERIRYEIDKIDPNYGGSSDLLRYAILSRFGGLYIDCGDVKAGNTPLAQCLSFSENQPKHVLYIDHMSQHPNPNSDQLAHFDLKNAVQNPLPIGNDTFICTKNNPLMERIYDTAKNNYELDEISKMIRVAYEGHNIHAMTIERTGPEIIQRILLEDVNLLEKIDDTTYQKNVGNSQVFLKPVRTLQYALTQPLSNARQWLKVPLRHCVDFEEAYQITLSTLRFEYTHFKILRLDDHVINIARSLKQEKKEQEIAETLVKRLQREQLPFDTIQVVQLLHIYPATVSYCIHHHLMEKTYSSISHMDINNRESVVKLSHVASYVTYARTIYFLVQESKRNDLYHLYSKNKIEDIAKRLNIGLKFMKRIAEYFPEDANFELQEILYQFQTTLEFYREFAPNLNKYLNNNSLELNEEEISSLNNMISAKLDELEKKEFNFNDSPPKEKRNENDNESDDSYQETKKQRKEGASPPPTPKI